MMDIENFAERAEHVCIPVLDITGYEAGALFLAVLAYPEDKNARKRFERATYFKIVEHLAKNNTWKNSNQTLRPDYLLQDRKLVEKEYKRGIRIIRQERMIAAQIAAPMDCYLVALVNGRGSIGSGGQLADENGYPRPISETSMVQASIAWDEIRKKNTNMNDGNIKTRCWKPSKPVLHLCLALQVTFNVGEEMSYLDLPFEEFFNNPNLIMTIIERAKFYRNFTANVFDIPKREQITLDWR